MHTLGMAQKLLLRKGFILDVLLHGVRQTPDTGNITCAKKVLKKQVRYNNEHSRIKQEYKIQ